MTANETISINCECGARHESGHMVIAAAEGLRLRPEGLMVDPSGWGLACYHDAPEDSDPARERNVLAVLAGFAVEKRFREEHSYPPRDYLDVTLNDDNRKARRLLGRLDGIYGTNDRRLREQLDGLVERYWRVIEALASELLRKNWESLKPLQSGCQWAAPSETIAKYLPGDEAVRILAEHRIVAVLCD